MTNENPTFQSLVSHLTETWRAHGCVILPGYDKPVGAGTLAPFTAMRLIENKDWSAAYLQPCRRPVDKLDATHTQLHHQFQVVLKPAPPDPTSLFAKSLSLENLVFKKDTWESPILGASGEGWEVSVNGIEIAQITVFNRIGRRKCEPALEIAYGLERIAMVQQGVSSIYDIKWDERHLYSDIYLPSNEASLDHYNRTSSQIRDLQKTLESKLSKYQNSTGLAFYENIVDASQIINELDARGALSPEAKTYYIRRACDLMEKLAVNDLDELTAQPSFQIFHPLIGLTHKRNERILKLIEWGLGKDTASNLERLVSLWGVGERADSGNDPYRLKETAKSLGDLRMRELSLALNKAVSLCSNGNKNFSQVSMEELKAFIFNSSK